MSDPHAHIRPESTEAPDLRESDYYRTTAERFRSIASRWRAQGRTEDAADMEQAAICFEEHAADLQRATLGRTALDEVL